jgi:hypothetical protein
MNIKTAMIGSKVVRIRTRTGAGRSFFADRGESGGLLTMIQLFTSNVCRVISIGTIVERPAAPTNGSNWKQLCVGLLDLGQTRDL